MLIRKVLALAALTGTEYTTQLSVTYVGTGCGNVQPCDHGGDLGKAILCGIALDHATIDYSVEDDTKDAVLDPRLLVEPSGSEVYSGGRKPISDINGEEDDYGTTEDESDTSNTSEDIGTTAADSTVTDNGGNRIACNMVLKWTAKFDYEDRTCANDAFPVDRFCVPDDVKPWMGRLHLNYLEIDGPDVTRPELTQVYRPAYVVPEFGKDNVCDGEAKQMNITGIISPIYEPTITGHVRAWRSITPPGTPLEPCYRMYYTWGPSSLTPTWFYMASRRVVVHTYQVYGHGNQLVYIKPNYNVTLIEPPLYDDTLYYDSQKGPGPDPGS